jgi:protease I
MSEKILIITGDGGEGYETWYAVHRFQEAGYDPIIAAPSKRRLHLVLHDFEPGWDTYIERQGYGAEASLTFDEVNVDDYFAILLIGGRAPEYLRHNETLLQITRDFYAKGKWVYSICHGIQILIAAGLADGKKLTCYEHVRFEVESNGGTYSTEEAIRDRNIISAQTWQSHPEFYREIFKAL